MKLFISSRKVLRILLLTIFILLIGNIVTIILLPVFDYNYNKSIIRMFNFNTEQNIPTLFSFLILGISSCLLFFIAKSNKNTKQDFKYWLFLGFVFMFLAVDEAVSIHEIIGVIVQKKYKTEGVFYFAWIIPYGILLLLLLIPLKTFLQKLPKNILRLFLISGLIFVIGAIGFEMVGSKIWYDTGKNNMNYLITYSIEETLEMIGISLFIYALLKYITITQLKPIVISFKS